MDERLTTADESHLEVLAVLHYVKAALWGLGGLGGFAWIFLGLFLGVAPTATGGEIPSGAPEVFGTLFGILGIGVILICIVMAAVTVYAGRCLQARRGRTFLFVLSAFHLLSMPLGTALGIFTMVVLCRPAVAAAFETRG